MTDRIIEASFDRIQATIVSYLLKSVCPNIMYILKMEPQFLSSLSPYWMPTKNIHIIIFIYSMFVSHRISYIYHKKGSLLGLLLATFIGTTCSVNVLAFLLGKPIAFAPGKLALVWSFFWVLFVAFIGRIPQIILTLSSYLLVLASVISVGFGVQATLKLSSITVLGGIFIAIAQTMSTLAFLTLVDGLVIKKWNWEPFLTEMPKTIVTCLAWTIYLRAGCSPNEVSWNKFALVLFCFKLLWHIIEGVVLKFKSLPTESRGQGAYFSDHSKAKSD